MITEELRSKIRRLYFAEHWKAGTIAAEFGCHRDIVLHAIEARSFLSATSCGHHSAARALRRAFRSRFSPCLRPPSAGARRSRAREPRAPVGRAVLRG